MSSKNNKIIAEIKYCYFEFKSTFRVLILFFLIYVVFFAYCIYQRKPLSEMTIAESIVLVQISTIYFYIKLLISSFSLPINVYSNEIENMGLPQKSSLYGGHFVYSINCRIAIKAIVNFVLSYLSFLLIFIALNSISVIRNYLLLIPLLLAEDLWLLALGSLISLGMLLFNVRKEFILFFEICAVFIFFLVDKHTYFLPSKIIMDSIESVFSSDIQYGQLVAENSLEDVPYILFIVFVSICVLILVSLVKKKVIISKLYKSKRGAAIEKNT